MDNKVMNNLSYGLFVLTAKGEKDNGCIINTASQVTTSPNRIIIAVNKQNYTHDLIVKSGVFNVSIIDESANFDLFKHFGFSSGRDTDKFNNYKDCKRAENGVLYVTTGINSVICGKVVSSTDLGTHTLFLADVTDGFKLNENASATYSFYHKNIKPKPETVNPAPAESKTEENAEPIYRCTICGYIHKGEMPDDFTCLWCRHPKEDFERIQ